MIKSFDDVLDKRIGAGLYQTWQFIVISMTEWFRGLIEVLLPILIIQWKSQLGITVIQQGELLSVYLLSQSIGTIFSLLNTNTISRSNLIVISYIGQTFSTLLLAVSQFPSHIFLAIFGYGFLQGMALPIAIVQIGEIMPSNIRGKMMVILYGIQILGSQFILLFCNFYLHSYEEGPWRGVVICLLPIYIVMSILSLITLKESPRFLLFQGKYTKAFQTMELMGEINRTDFLPLTEREKGLLVRWTQMIKREQLINVASLSDLFNSVNFTNTVSILIIHFLLGFVIFGYIILVPNLLNESIFQFTDQMKVYIGDLFGLAFNIIVIENKNFGRKNSVQISLILFISFQLIIVKFEKNILTLCLIGVRFSIRVMLPCIALISMESYSTLLRSMGVGSAQLAMKIGGILSAYYILQLFEWFSYNILFLLIFLCLICVFVVQIYVDDKTKQQLDQSSDTLSQK